MYYSLNSNIINPTSIVKTYKNGSCDYTKLVVCDRCGGSGIYQDLGNCFKCLGNGKNIEKFKGYNSLLTVGGINATEQALAKSNAIRVEQIKEIGAKCDLIGKKARIVFKLIRVNNQQNDFTYDLLSKFSDCLVKGNLTLSDKQMTFINQFIQNYFNSDYDQSNNQKVLAFIKERINIDYSYML